jgi:hypothetical protein
MHEAQGIVMQQPDAHLADESDPMMLTRRRSEIKSTTKLKAQSTSASLKCDEVEFSLSKTPCEGPL